MMKLGEQDVEVHVLTLPVALPVYRSQIENERKKELVNEGDLVRSLHSSEVYGSEVYD